ncbi:biosynthetic arginine decarboxylase [Proteobacteria bacterium 005FR1]|nr:biosynthetic arginine decarboxylase [Proteobacteria bacterium 005FR1]
MSTIPDRPRDPRTISALTDTSEEQWSAAASADLYGIREWGADYFHVNDDGLVTVRVPFGDKSASVPLMSIVQGMKERGLEMPVVLRIENLLDHRITQLNEAFAKAIAGAGYRNEYRGVFPIKVNQQFHVIEEIASFGARYHHGLEAGSKAELIIALSQLEDPESLIVCNGYKDAEFIELGLYAVQMGIRCFFVAETPAEIPIIIERSKAMGIRPLIGVRMKLSAKVDGYWAADSGDQSIFGLTPSQLISVIDQLKAADMLDCLQLLHAHIGSQIPNIRNIRVGVLEACRYYVSLVEEGAPMGYLDLGGGLAVDYDGTRSNSTHSMNYRLDEYCVDIVEAVIETLDSADVPHPVIVTESGRATVAYSSVLLFNVLDVRKPEPANLPAQPPEDAHELIVNLATVMSSITPSNLQESFNDALYYRDEVYELFRHGQMNLRHRALADKYCRAVLYKIAQLLPQARRVSPELEALPELLSDVYYGNFSVFQSLPDIWAIDQLFPIMPIERLKEKPTRQAILADLTCDCDGKIDRFAHPNGELTRLPLHAVNRGEEYHLAVFLVGAYQETLGDLHNLFGDTNVVSVRIEEDGHFEFVREFQGDRIADVLTYVEYNPQDMLEKFRKSAERAVRRGKISPAARKEMLQAFTDSLRGYTYFER